MMNSRQQPVATSSYYYHHPHSHSYHDPTLVSLAYRPLQYPLQLGGLPAPANQQHQHQHQQAQLSLAAAGFQQQQTFRPQQHLQHHHHQVPLRTRHSSRQVRAPSTMAFDQQAQGSGMTEDELAEFQKASNEYQPESTVCAVARFRVAGRSESELQSPTAMNERLGRQ